MTNPSRTMAAVLTPCFQKGIIDENAMTQLTRFLTSRGCDGLFVPSSTGEAALLDDASRRRLVSAARQGCPADVEIWSGISGLGLQHSIQLARSAAAEGANGGVIMAPYFGKLSQVELIDYCRRIADASPMAIGIYHHLKMPTAFEPETVAVLAKHANIRMFKDTSGDLERMREIISLTRGHDFRTYQGSEKLLLSSLEAGATGGITALANILPELHRGLVDDFLAGKMAQATQRQETLERFWLIFRQPEAGASFSSWLRTVTLPLCWRGIFEGLASINSNASDMKDFDSWLERYYSENDLKDILLQKSPALVN